MDRRSDEIIGSYMCPRCKNAVRSGHACQYCNNMMGIQVLETIQELKPKSTHHSEMYPGVGVGVLVFNKDYHLLLGKRKGSHGEGEYSIPGGWVEHGETLKRAAVRELREEVGLYVSEEELSFLKFEESFEYMPKHVINFGFALWYHGKREPKLLEPDKCEGWGWYDLDSLPEPIGSLTENLIIQNARNQYLAER
ncbi:MAG: nucleotide triphosphate diphosphatase NUDT15 [Candidatus Pacearchaeota archaeon]